MPFTPFHFGPGLALKAMAMPHFSWLAFCTVQVLIDCETLWFLVRGEPPVHRFAHTYLGATLVGGAGAGALWLAGRRWPGGIRGTRPPGWWGGELTARGLWAGGLSGGATHVLLDSILHRDMLPFLPWSATNPLWRVIAPGPLHALCLAAFVAGGIGIMLPTMANRPGKRP